MHHLSRFFVHKEEEEEKKKNNKKKRRDMESKNKPRRLDRRYANNNINYEPTTPFPDQSVSLRTRSLDLYPVNDETSFRIDGNEGIDAIFQKIGLSGFEDFAIPADAWEARKMRSSSDVLPVSSTTEVDEPTDKKKSDNAIVAGVGMIADTVIVSDMTTIPVSVGGGNGGGGGIKGIRPPLLAPPPVISLPKMDTDCSTWDLLNSFAPDGDICSSNSRGVLDSDEEVDREIIQQREANDTGFAGRNVLSASCSFTTSNDDDCSSTTTEPMSNNISPNLRIKRTIRRWDKGETVLGRGSFGSVYVGIAEDGFFFAVKEVSLLDQGDIGKQCISQLEQEIALLSQFEHENIVQYYGTDRDESNLYIFLELVTMGSLLTLYHKYPLRLPVVSSYTRQILHGLMYLHEQNVVHRDIKCANILVDANGSVKLADFGLAKATKLNDVKSCQGTPFWMAPEVSALLMSFDCIMLY
ncbi:mitogen-activated protein kinase kinase kinase 1-like [Impatiens glandulifera]|uniref:mitogen-activated protein kinase kinase kinase 1-like n=1 Tax=Impatiens glandulifera TaxID=253017 RepID=UPI001FB17B3E|nr:mitogen-activated protein kinase kinase kinase 1-like [Impatiens glandulifera]